MSENEAQVGDLEAAECEDGLEGVSLADLSYSGDSLGRLFVAFDEARYVLQGTKRIGLTNRIIQIGEGLKTITLSQSMQAFGAGSDFSPGEQQVVIKAGELVKVAFTKTP